MFANHFYLNKLYTETGVAKTLLCKKVKTATTTEKTTTAATKLTVKKIETVLNFLFSFDKFFFDFKLRSGLIQHFSSRASLYLMKNCRNIQQFQRGPNYKNFNMPNFQRNKP